MPPPPSKPSPTIGEAESLPLLNKEFSISYYTPRESLGILTVAFWPLAVKR